MAKRCDVAVIGAGLIGLGTARALMLARPGLKLTVLDKEATLGRHQSGRNSGVLHSGVYYRPGSLKAQLCRRGKDAMERFADEHGIPFRTPGKLIVATDESELPRLAELRTRALANDVPGLRELRRDEITEIEPHAVGLRALHVPHTGVIDYGAVLLALADDLRTRGADLLLGREAQRVVKTARGVSVETPVGPLEADAAIACVAVQSDRLARRSGVETTARIVPFRGDYYTLTGESADLVRGLVYPVPDPRFPFLGVHFTRKVDDTVVAGPNAVLALARERHGRASLDPRDAVAALAFPGLWRFAFRHGRIAAAEVRRDVSKRAFVGEMRRYLPGVSAGDAVFGPSGIRAQAMRTDGTLIDDFVIEGGGRAMHVLNAPSPGATASLAIGEELADRALRDLLPP